MKIKTKFKVHALTRADVLVVLAVAIVLAIVFLPIHRPSKRKYAAIVCINNLKQIGSAFTSYANENNGKYPFQVSVANGGTMELISNNFIYPHYQTLSNYLNDPKVFICPYDKEREPAKSIAMLKNSNASYFLNIDAVRFSPKNSILLGDRFFQTNGQSVKSGLFLVTTNLNISWTLGVHNGGGNIVWSDGSSEQTSTHGLPLIIGSQQLVTNRFLMP